MKSPAFINTFLDNLHIFSKVNGWEEKIWHNLMFSEFIPGFLKAGLAEANEAM